MPMAELVRYTVLVCDDQQVLRDLVRGALAEGGYDIIEAQDGDQAIELARSRRPDLIVLDMVMPGRSGLDVLVEVRRDPRLVGTRVVMCSASSVALPEGVDADSRADRYLRKPFSPRELAATVEELLAG